VYAWAKAASKPTYTAAEVGAPSGSGSSTGTNTGDQDLSGKQDVLVSGTNVKTVGGASIVGSGNVDSLDINGGTIDGTVIGGSTPAAGNFTSVSASGDVGAYKYAPTTSWAQQNLIGHRWTGALDSTRISVPGFTANSAFLDLDAAGNLGIGVVTHPNGIPTIQSQFGILVGNLEINLAANVVFDGVWEFKSTGYATHYAQLSSSGLHQWFSSSGVAGDSVAMVTKMALDSAGNLSNTGSHTIGSFTTATRPAHAAGKMIYVSDGGAGAVFQGSNGSAWVNLG